MEKQSTTIRIISLLKQKKREASLLFGLVLISTGFDITVPFISQRLIDTLIKFFRDGGNTPTNILIFSALGILAATVVARMLKSTYDYHLFKMVTQLEDTLRKTVFEKYLKLHVLF